MTKRKAENGVELTWSLTFAWTSDVKGHEVRKGSCIVQSSLAPSSSALFRFLLFFLSPDFVLSTVSALKVAPLSC